MRERTGAKFLVHRTENENLRDIRVNLTSHLGMKNIEIEADSRVDDGDTLHIGNLVLKVIHTPGHTSRRNFALFRRI
ncbi:MAG: MBL fold metallo-hydrolase [Clostridia bacterium]|nr:MBL fold metallo-hydrolase [Clostridia bacterium]